MILAGFGKGQLKILDFGSNHSITDEGLSYLTGIEVLHLSSNTKITNQGISYLKGIREFRVGLHPYIWNPHVTGECLIHLKGA